MVAADPSRIEEMVSNLLDNAKKFTERGEITVTAAATAAGDGNSSDEAVVTVTDTGTGIDPKVMPRLFSRFASKSDRGTGLGLFISKSIVEAHGGKIWAEDNPDGAGAAFTFTLPLARSNSYSAALLFCRRPFM